MSATASNLTREEARQRAALIGDVAYDVSLDLAGDDEVHFGSTTTIRFVCATPGADTFLDLAATSVDRLTVNGSPADVDFADGRLALTDLESENVVEVVATCDYSRSGVGLHRFVDPADDATFLYTQFEPHDAHRVFACFDQPDLKAVLTMSATAPAGWEVISNGAVTSRPADGAEGVWTFAATPPIPTYIAALVAGPYHRVEDSHGDIALGVYCRQSMAAHLDADEILTITKQGLDWFQEVFDYPYPFGKYDQLFVPEFNFGAMENPGCVTFSERYVFRSRVTQAAHLSRANTILHEMAHMWFGDLVTMRWWDDLWLNESFATFMAHTAVSQTTRFGDDSWSDFAHSMKAWAYQQDQLPSTHPIVADIVDTESVMANFDGITYAKGASVLKQLHAWVGADSFRQGIRDYFQTHAFGNAELTDFLGALEKPSGRQLAPWAAEWLQTAGVATLSADIATDDDGIMTRVVINQTAIAAQPTIRAHRLAIGLYDVHDRGLELRERVEVDIEGAATALQQLVGKPRPDLLLVNDQDLAYAKVRFDARSVDTMHRSLGTLEDGVGRAVCWGGLWDATRDGEIPARVFADLVAEHGPVEEDISVLQTLLRQASACADRYGDPANRDVVQQRIAAVARAGIDRSEPSSDRQLLWVRALVGTGCDPAFGIGLLDGSHVVEGLTVDADLRWMIVANLAATGDIPDGAIDAELARDKTDVGMRGAESARAAQPDAAAKAASWERALDRSLAMHTRRAALRGFWQVDQGDVLAEYTDAAWVDALPGLWAAVSGEEALSMTESLYPSVMVSESVVAAAERALELDLPSLAKRAIAEGRDGTLRALRAQAVDRAAS